MGSTSGHGADDGVPVQVLPGRPVPLGGVRALEVRRTLPHRDRAMVGAWSFADHYGPEVVRDASRDGMDVPPHPHLGLQTVSWLFAGAIEHRDSGGVHAIVRPGEVDLMTAGAGIVHSEVTTPETDVLHGVQLWVALPAAARDAPRAFEHHRPEAAPLPGGAGTALVFLGALPGVDSSPVRTHTPLLGAELRLAPGATVDLAVDPAFEHALLLDQGTVTVEGSELRRGDLGVVETGRDRLLLQAGAQPVRGILLGGVPFDEQTVLWWNFLGRSHEEIARAREQYEAGDERFGGVEGYTGQVRRLPAPPMPPVRLRPRGRSRR